MKAIILCGGEGKRLRPLTNLIPKPLIMIGNKPCVQHIIENLRSYGIEDIMLSLWHNPYSLTRYAVENKIGFDVQRKNRDTAGAIKNLSWWVSDPFLVVNGDTLSAVNINKMLAFHQNSPAIATIFNPNPDQISHNGGTYIFEKKVLERIPNKRYSLHKDLLPSFEVVNIFNEGSYYDIGTMEKLKLALEVFK